ncbi:MAG: UDP-N-acetylmuramoyl-L-alanyl-D-glutamate--2,6-diaminopimelate ligase, partial [Myxococcota bacterium]
MSLSLETLASRLAAHVPVTRHGDAAVTGVQHDSRAVATGDLFVAVPGATVDGARFATAAQEAGAAALLAERRLPETLPQLVVGHARTALAHAAHAVYGDPLRTLSAVGITGTNGKTTTAWMLDGALRHLGTTTALLGTVSERIGERVRPARFTTPEADDLARFAREAVGAGATHLVMEVSSHGLDQRRADGGPFAVAAFTNLTQDHLDYHGTMEAYGAAKARLFTELGPGASVINVDDDFGRALAARASGTVWRVALTSADAELRATLEHEGPEGMRARVRTPAGEGSLHTRLVGRHNLENLLVALGVLHALDVPLADALAGLGAAPGAPGRLERVEDPAGRLVLVDYAHTPDALARALAAVRPFARGRLVVVFGCGGDRDQDKRPRMGAAAAAGADLVVVTSDNPRSEDPQAIVDAILPGLGEG